MYFPSNTGGYFCNVGASGFVALQRWFHMIWLSSSNHFCDCNISYRENIKFTNKIYRIGTKTSNRLLDYLH